MNYKKALPYQAKKKEAGETDKEISSRVKRRKNFNPRRWASKWLKDSGGLPARIYVAPVDRPGVICTKCGYTYFADVYGDPDPATFVCTNCEEVKVVKVEGEVEKPRTVPPYIGGYSRS